MKPARQVRRPLTAIALFFATGLTLQQRLPLSPLLLLSLGAFLLAWLCHRRSTPILYLTCAWLAMTYGSIGSAPRLHPASPIFYENPGNQQCVTGNVIDDPVLFSERMEFRLKSNPLGPRHKQSVLRVYIRNPQAPVTCGERWKITGNVTAYGRARNGAEGYLSASGDDAVRLSPARPSLKGLCYHFRHRAADILRSTGREFPEQTGILQALLLGYRQQIEPELYQTFARTGALHIFAISGLHVGVMASILIALLKTAGVTRPRWGLLLIPVLFLYVVSTGMKPSALRAFTMAAVYFAAPLAGRRPDAPSAIALAAGILLLIRPGQISEPGFLLSFLVVSGIIMVHSGTVRRMKGLYRKGWELPLRQLSGPHPAAALLRATGLLMLTSVAAWLFSMPLTARFFNTLSPIAMIGNLFIIPLTFIIVLTGCLTLIGGIVFVPAADLFMHANRMFISALIKGIQSIEALPGAWFFVRAPSMASVFLWYSGLTLFFVGPARLRKPALILTLLSVVLWSTEIVLSREEILLWSQADSAHLLHLPPDRWVLVSNGDAFNIDHTVRLLQKQGVNRLDALVVSDRWADSKAVLHLQNIFRPDTLWDAKENNRPCWPVGEGSVFISNGSPNGLQERP